MHDATPPAVAAKKLPTPGQRLAAALQRINAKATKQIKADREKRREGRAAWLASLARTDRPKRAARPSAMPKHANG